MDFTWLNSIDSWITSQNLLPYLIDWTSGGSGVIKNGSNQVSRWFGLGTTWLPRLGDLAPKVLANTTFAASGISSQPTVTISNGQFMYYGTARGGSIRLENIRRIHRQGFTCMAVYRQAHGGGQGLIAYGQNRIYLHATTTQLNFRVGNGTVNVNDAFTTSLPSNTANIVGGTFDLDKAIAYNNGSAGSGASGYVSAAADGSYGELRPLLGGAKGRNAQVSYQLGVAGFTTGVSGITNNSPLTSPTPTISGGFSTPSADFAEIIMFATCLTPTQMASLNTLLRTRY